MAFFKFKSGKKQKDLYLKIPHVKTIRELLQRACDNAGDRIAYKYFVGHDIHEITYRGVKEDTRALGTALCEAGYVDKHVAMIGTNSYDYITVYLTMLQSTGVFVPVDKELTEVDYLNVIRDSDAALVFCTAHYEESLRANRDTLPHVKQFVVIEREEDDGEFLSYRKFIEAGRTMWQNGDTRYEDAVGNTDDLRLLVYTSGTTGIAKGVMLSEKNIISCFGYGLELCPSLETALSVLPYNHTYEAVGLFAAMYHYTTVCINDNLRHVLKNMQTFKPDYIYLVPAFVEVFYKKIWATAKAEGKELALKALVASVGAMKKILSRSKRAAMFKSVHAAFGGNLKKIVCGGAPLRPELGDFFNTIGIDLVNGYGITECSPLVSVNPVEDNNPATVGYPLRCVEIKLDDITKDNIGEICVRGDNVMLGYYKQPEMTKEVMDRDGFFHTGDYGTVNAKGQIVITGRKKNLIILDNGKNIFPEEIEGYISSIPYVQEVIVFGIKNADGMECALGAELFLNEERLQQMKITDPESILSKDIAKACKALPAYKRIARYFIRPVEFKKTTTKKIKRDSLMFANTPLHDEETSKSADTAQNESK